MFSQDSVNRDWLERGNSLEVYFEELEHEVWQGNTVVVDDLALEVCAVRRAMPGFRVYVTAASALKELDHACR
jgi:hypothetical protein